MKLKLVCTAAAALLSFAACAQTQSGSGLPPSGGGLSTPPPLAAPSTGTSGDRAGVQGSTAPRSNASETSVGVSGAYSPPAPDRTSGLCDTLTGDERIRCQREQAATGTQGSGSAGAGSTGMGR